MDRPAARLLAATTILIAVSSAALATEHTTAAIEGQRLAGEGRRDTAIAISKHVFPDGSLEVYISNEQVNPDALAGGALTKGPILLVPQCGTLPDEVADEIVRLAPYRVYALGGPNTVCDSMLEQAAAAAPAPADRPPQTITRTMSGEGATDAFELVGGSYLVTYDYESPDCHYYASLDRTDASGNESLPDEDAGPVSGEVYIHNVAPGMWAMEMLSLNASGCPWTITLSNEG